MNKTPITDACFLAQGEPPEALIERLAKTSRILEERLTEIAIEHVQELAEVTRKRDAAKEDLGMSIAYGKDAQDMAIKRTQDRDRLAAENAKLRTATASLLALLVEGDYVAHLLGCPEDDTCKCEMPRLINAAANLIPNEELRSASERAQEALRTGGAK